MGDDSSYCQSRWNPPGLIPLRDPAGLEAERLDFIHRYIAAHRPLNEIETREVRRLEAALRGEKPRKVYSLADFEEELTNETR